MSSARAKLGALLQALEAGATAVVERHHLAVEQHSLEWQRPQRMQDLGEAGRQSLPFRESSRAVSVPGRQSTR